MNSYTPNPIDVSDVQLPAELENLAGLLAANVHEVWAAGRIAEGWTYGPVRDDAKKETPCIVPFDALTDIERSYDLNTAFGTLKLLIKLGYTIVPPQEQEAQ